MTPVFLKTFNHYFSKIYSTSTPVPPSRKTSPPPPLPLFYFIVGKRRKFHFFLKNLIKEHIGFRFLHIFVHYALNNKHKFVQKVAKKSILLISFKFTSSIISLTRLNRDKYSLILVNRSYTGLNWVKPG